MRKTNSGICKIDKVKSLEANFKQWGSKSLDDDDYEQGEWGSKSKNDSIGQVEEKYLKVETEENSLRSESDEKELAFELKEIVWLMRE